MSGVRTVQKYLLHVCNPPWGPGSPKAADYPETELLCFLESQYHFTNTNEGEAQYHSAGSATYLVCRGHFSGLSALLKDLNVMRFLCRPWDLNQLSSDHRCRDPTHRTSQHNFFDVFLLCLDLSFISCILGWDWRYSWVDHCWQSSFLGEKASTWLHFVTFLYTFFCWTVGGAAVKDICL